MYLLRPTIGHQPFDLDLVSSSYDVSESVTQNTKKDHHRDDPCIVIKIKKPDVKIWLYDYWKESILNY